MQTKCYDFYTHYLLLARSIHIRLSAIGISIVYIILVVYLIYIHISVYSVYTILRHLVQKQIDHLKAQLTNNIKLN